MVFTEHINDIMHLHSNMIDQGFKPVRYYVPVIAQLLWCQKTKAKYKEDYVCVWSHCSLLYYIISINPHQDGHLVMSLGVYWKPSILLLISIGLFLQNV